LQIKFLKTFKRDFKTIKYFLKLSNNISKEYLPLIVLTAISKALQIIVNIVMPKFIIDELMNGKRIEVFIKLILITIIVNAVIGGIISFLNKKNEIISLKIKNGFYILVGDKVMTMDFEKIEDPEVLDLKERALFPVENQGMIQRTIDYISKLLTSIITMIAVMSIILTLDVYVILIVLTVVILNMNLNKKEQIQRIKSFEEIIPINRKFSYYINMVTDFKIAKDVRLYNMENILMKEIIKFTNLTRFQIEKICLMQGKFLGLNYINIQIQMFAIYCYMTYKVFIGAIGIGQFSMYVSAANSFSSSLAEFFRQIMNLNEACTFLRPYFEFEGLPSKNSEGNRKIESLEKYDIEFKNVSFKYPRSENYTIKNINIKINYGEKLSVVGLNGAGKTTFIKLLSRLYEPSEGEILLNGVNIKDYNYDEYMKLLGVVFQDFKLLGFTIKENISFGEGEDTEKIYTSLKKSGIYKDIEKLEKGIETTIYKTFEDDGIEFSGGQAQKLAISRTMYKDSPIVILDEPTAALDPLAEFEIYSKFNELIGEKTALYISHRLSSSKFCDKIVVFDKGEIIQYGTHDKLIQEEGLYNEMYMAQATYYN